jgi:exonuclease SbcD
MKFLHTSDLHIGKRLHEQPLIEQQRQTLSALIHIAREHSVSAALIAGDVYDRGVPTLDAVNAVDDFITELSSLNISVFIIAGNHDSAERLDFGARIMSRQNVHISGSELRCVPMSDEYGGVNVWLLPYMRAQTVEETLGAAEVDIDARNIILAHQFVISAGSPPEIGGSEIKIVGGVDAVDASLFDRFDYVALGHIHRPQSAGRTTARYSGSPYRYSFDECGHTKQAVVVEVREKGDTALDFVTLTPTRDLYAIRCELSELATQTAPRDSYAEITLTDDEPLVDAITKVRDIYPNTLRLVMDNKYTRHIGATHTLTGSDIKAKTPIELFEGFFEEVNGAALNEAQRELVQQAMEGDDDETH